MRREGQKIRETPPTGRLDELLSGLLSQRFVKQAILALESGDRSIRWIGARAEAHPDVRPINKNTPFFLASIDKLFNATVVMKLSESGRIDVDAAISTYLPYPLWRGLHRLDGVDYSEQITVRHLLGHTSGLADWLEDRPKGGRSLTERLFQDGDLAIDFEDIADTVRKLKPHFPPQDLAAGQPRARYSDTNYMLLIAIIEAVTGQLLYEVHDELLLKPLALRHTYFPGFSEPLDPTPEPAVLRLKGHPFAIPSLIRSVRGIYSTAGDTLSFLRSFVRGEIFEKPETLSSMERRWIRFRFPLDRAALRSPGWPIEYGLGIMRFRLPRLLTSLRSIPPVIGHTGSTGCWLFYCPQMDVLISGSVDEATAGALPYRTVPKILEILRHWSTWNVVKQRVKE
jgi:CubicO group peptidase (beta-lactamase class C family)